MPFFDPTDTSSLWPFGGLNMTRAPKLDTKLHRITVHVPDRDIETTRVRGVGYRQTSACGAFTARANRVDAVRAAMREHRSTCAACKAATSPATAREREH